MPFGPVQRRPEVKPPEREPPEIPLKPSRLFAIIPEAQP